VSSPPHRAPRPAELETCKAAWLDRQIELIDPRIVVLWGVRRSANVHGIVRTRGGRSYLITYPGRGHALFA
jgi:uracil-DNA glycosylase